MLQSWFYRARGFLTYRLPGSLVDCNFSRVLFLAGKSKLVRLTVALRPRLQLWILLQFLDPVGVSKRIQGVF